jgi:Ca-activated chloride channel family protein
VASDADEHEIKQDYRQLARRYHPDTAEGEAGAEAVEQFRQVQQAYELLTDPQQRETYDHWRRERGLDRPPAFTMSTALSQEFLPCLGEPQVLYTLVQIVAAEDVEGRRLPLNLCLVIDRSTSMKGARLQQAKEAARYIVDQLGEEDVLALIAFSDRAEVVVHGQWPFDKAEARAAISRIQASGGTELLQGLKEGLQELNRWRGEGRVSSLILLTDGQTYGDEKGCLEEAGWAGQQRIPLVTMGVGADWNDDLLDQMARLSGGTSLYIDSAAKIAQAFQDQIHSLGHLYAQDLTLAVHCGEGVSVQEAFCIAPLIAPLRLADGRAPLGLLEKGQPQAVLLELLVDRHEPGRSRLVQLEVGGVVPAIGPQVARARHEVTVTFTADLAGRRVLVPPDVVTAMGKLTIFKMQERALAEAKMGQIEAAVGRLKTLATRLLNIGEADLARAALIEAGNLAQTGSLSGEGRKKLRYGTRGLAIVPKEVRK